MASYYKMLELKLSRIRNIIPDDGEKLAQNVLNAYDTALKYDDLKSISNIKPITSIDNSKWSSFFYKQKGLICLI